MKRYRIWWSEQDLEECDDGDMVDYEDYAALEQENATLHSMLTLADALRNKQMENGTMLTTKQAARLRGLINYALEMAAEDAHAGAQDPHTAMHVRGEYKLAKQNLLAEIRELTEPKGK